MITEQRLPITTVNARKKSECGKGWRCDVKMYINYSPQYSQLVITTLHNFVLATGLSSAPKAPGYFNLTPNYRLPAICTQPPPLP
jgi:hypothetical protein